MPRCCRGGELPPRGLGTGPGRVRALRVNTPGVRLLWSSPSQGCMGPSDSRLGLAVGTGDLGSSHSVCVFSFSPCLSSVCHSCPLPWPGLPGLFSSRINLLPACEVEARIRMFEPLLCPACSSLSLLLPSLEPLGVPQGAVGRLGSFLPESSLGSAPSILSCLLFS